MAAGLMLAAILSVGTGESRAQGQNFSILDETSVAGDRAGAETLSRDFQLLVYVNDQATELIAEVRQEPDGTLSMDSTQLYNVGILPAASARQADGRVNLERLPGVAVRLDDFGQALYFEAGDGQRAPRTISAAPRMASPDLDDPRNEVKSGFGALMNYTLNASSLYELEHSRFYSSGVSGTLEGRFFSPAGVFENSVSFYNDTFRRLDTSWSYSDPHTLHTFRAGDLITSGLSWTRPTRLAGVQLQKNFSLRSGLITMPVPGFTGSAAVPSTVDVFLNNTRRFSSDVASGPFEVVDMPVATGPGTASVVVRDELGNETIVKSDYFVSDRLLRPGLLDYSFEAGFPRVGFGTDHDQYDERLFASTSLRYGVAHWLTWEGHAEGGADLLNGGMALVSGLGSWGVGSLAVAGSTSHKEQGYQVTGALEVALGDLRLHGRLQRSYGDYHDIASVTLRDGQRNYGMPETWGTPTRSMEQVSVSMPILDLSFLNVSYTQREDLWDRQERLIGASYSQPLFGGSFTASGFTDTERDNWGFFAAFSVPIGEHMSAGTTARSNDDGYGLAGTVTQSPHEDNGNFGWQLQYEQNDSPRLFARGDVETPIARLGGTLRQTGDASSGAARISGSVVAAGGGIFLSNRIDDAFAIIDAGAEGVPVLYENRPAGTTGADGLLLVPDLRSFERNRLGIDPTNLPLDVAIDSTRQIVIPADRTGVVVSFADRSSGGSALVVFNDEKGEHIGVGSTVTLTAGKPAIVGYGGQAYLTGLQRRNTVTIRKPWGESCTAEFFYNRDEGNQVQILDVPCLP